jgi:hypothetical protein
MFIYNANNFIQIYVNTNNISISFVVPYRKT